MTLNLTTLGQTEQVHSSANAATAATKAQDVFNIVAPHLLGQLQLPLQYVSAHSLQRNINTKWVVDKLGFNHITSFDHSMEVGIWRGILLIAYQLGNPYYSKKTGGLCWVRGQGGLKMQGALARLLEMNFTLVSANGQAQYLKR